MTTKSNLNGKSRKSTSKGTSKGTKAEKKGTEKKRKTNLLRLCSMMSKYAADANDKEIIKRFKTTIFSSSDDITKSSLDLIINNPKDLELNNFSENIQPYIKHYLFMVKRDRLNK
ncbi:MAG: hypothetical protein SVZ03_06360 [Spirochaetota bacterium]|nr:hypothetical protein [Spirochaetota bacterium]